MKYICPVCQKPQSSRGLSGHIRFGHPKEFKEIGYRKLKSQARKIPKKLPAKEEAKPEGAPKDKEMAAWFEETQKKLGFFPSPASLAIIQSFTKSTDPSDFVNEAIINEGKKRGITAALIKTEGGESMELMGTKDTDVEFNRLLKLISASTQINQSYNQNSPMVMMMEMMKKKVNNGMNMGQFGKELMGMVMMIKMMEGM